MQVIAKSPQGVSICVETPTIEKARAFADRMQNLGYTILSVDLNPSSAGTLPGGGGKPDQDQPSQRRSAHVDPLGGKDCTPAEGASQGSECEPGQGKANRADGSGDAFRWN